VQSLQNKLKFFDVLLQDDLAHVHLLCICEHWMSEDVIKMVCFNNFNLVTNFSRKLKKHGGVAVFAHYSLNVETLKVRNYCTEMHVGVAAVKIKKNVFPSRLKIAKIIPLNKKLSIKYRHSNWSMKLVVLTINKIIINKIKKYRKNILYKHFISVFYPS